MEGCLSNANSLTLRRERGFHRAVLCLTSINPLPPLSPCLSLSLCYSNSLRRRRPNPTSRSGPCRRRRARPSTAAWCRSSTMKTGSVEHKQITSCRSRAPLPGLNATHLLLQRARKCLAIVSELPYPKIGSEIYPRNLGRCCLCGCFIPYFPSVHARYVL